MRNRIYLCIIAIFFIGTCFLRAQCVNVGFEDGTFNSWSCATAKNLTPSNASLGSGPGGYGYANPGGWPHGNVTYGVNNKYHKILTTNNNIDSCITQQSYLSFIGQNSACIGDYHLDTNKTQSVLLYKFKVGQLNRYFKYNYTFKFYSGCQSKYPFFEFKIVTASDSTTVLPCSYRSVSPYSYDPVEYLGANCYLAYAKYLPWQEEVVDLSNYIGQDLIAVFTVSDCTDGNHKAWAFVDAACVDSATVLKNNSTCKSSVILTPPKLIGNNFSYSWNPGNGLGSFYNATSSGIYTLTVIDTVNNNACYRTFYYDVKMYPPANALLQASYDSVVTYSFSGSSVQGSGVVKSWLWDFGDGTVSSEKNVQHKYLFPGSYNVCLKIVDSLSCVDTSCISSIKVNALAGLDACYNDDFEEGTLFGWRPIVTNNFTTMNALWGTESGGYGYSNPSGWPLKNTMLTKPIDQTYFKIKDDPNELDTCGLFPVVYSPGKNTLKIGHSYRGRVGTLLGSNTEQSRVYKRILVTNSNKYFKYNYACVLMIHGSGSNANETFFEVKAVLASDSSTVIPQSYFKVIVGSGFAGSKLSSCKNDGKIFRYIPWSIGYIDLSAYVGQEVLVVFTASDCAESGHAAWAYIEGECLSDVPVTKVGTCGGQVTLNATPASSPTYLWQPGNVITPFYKTSTAGIYTLNLTSRFFQDTITKPYLYEVVSTPAIVTSIQSNLLNDSLVNFVGSVSVSAGSIQKWSWNFGDNNSSSIQNPTHIFTHAGSYNVCLTATDSLGCSDSSCVTIAVGGTLGVKSIVNTNDQVAVYPNPSLDGFFNITSNSEPIVSIAIYNIQGVVIKHTKTNGLNSQLNLSELAGGLYYLNIQTLDGKQFLKKVSYINKSY